MSLTDETIRHGLETYTQEAADRKDAVGRAILDEIEAGSPPEAAPRRKRRLPTRYTAAAAVLILAAGLALFFQTPPGKNLAAQLYEALVQPLLPDETPDEIAPEPPDEISPGPEIADLYSPVQAEDDYDGPTLTHTLMPHGEIVAAGEGLASYVIYIDERYTVELSADGLTVRGEYPSGELSPEYETALRQGYAQEGWSQEEIDFVIAGLNEVLAELPGDQPPASLHITQEAGVTVEERAGQLLADGEFVQGVWDSNTAASVALESMQLLDGYETTVAIYLLDNGQGGIFVITMQTLFWSSEPHAIRLLDALDTLEIIDIYRAE